MATPKQNKIDPYYIDIYKQVEQLKKDVDSLKGKEITTNDLPMSSLKQNLERSWNPDANVLLGKGTVKAGSIGVLPGCKASLLGAKTWAGAATHVIEFDSDAPSGAGGAGFDTDDMYNSAISTTNIYARKNGWYTVIGTLAADITTTGANQVGQLFIDKNAGSYGTSVINISRHYYPTAATWLDFHTLAGSVYMKVGDYVRLVYVHDATAVRNTAASTSLSLLWHSAMAGA